jgi:hypothetical protein
VASPQLKKQMAIYTEDCLSEVLAVQGERSNLGLLDQFFSAKDTTVDERLGQIPINFNEHETCLDLKKNILQQVFEEAEKLTNDPNLSYARSVTSSASKFFLSRDHFASNIIVNHYLDQREATMGVDRTALLPTTGARLAQYLQRFSDSPFQGILDIFSRENRGVFLAGKRAEDLAQNMSRAPHVSGFLKLLLIAAFPFLILPVLMGYWKSLLWWTKVYFSILLWPPIWTILYSIVTGIAMSASELRAIDDVSLVGAELVNSRLNYLYAVYSWIQLMLGIGVTGSFLTIAAPFAKDTEAEDASATQKTVGTAISTVTTVASGGTKAIAGQAALSGARSLFAKALRS